MIGYLVSYASYSSSCTYLLPRQEVHCEYQLPTTSDVPLRWAVERCCGDSRSDLLTLLQKAAPIDELTCVHVGDSQLARRLAGSQLIRIVRIYLDFPRCSLPERRSLRTFSRQSIILLLSPEHPRRLTVRSHPLLGSPTYALKIQLGRLLDDSDDPMTDTVTRLYNYCEYEACPSLPPLLDFRRYLHHPILAAPSAYSLLPLYSPFPLSGGHGSYFGKKNGRARGGLSRAFAVDPCDCDVGAAPGTTSTRPSWTSWGVDDDGSLSTSVLSISSPSPCSSSGSSSRGGAEGATGAEAGAGGADGAGAEGISSDVGGADGLDVSCICV